MEYGVACFLREYIKKNLRSFRVEEEKVEEGRVNLFVHDGADTNLLLMCHMDTAEEGNDWTFSSRGEQRGLRFYGRGSLDAKCGLVAILSALKEAEELGKTGIAALFYCDEEYHSIGMKKFIQEFRGRLNPKLVLCIEPTNGMLRRGGRGITEIRYVLRGKSGHAARLKSGISAFDGLNLGIQSLKEYLLTVVDPYLGHPTLNVATVRCGAIQRRRPDGFIEFGSSGNIIPDYCELVIDVRTIPGIDSQGIQSAFHAGVRKAGVVIESTEVTKDLISFVSPGEPLKFIENIKNEVMGDTLYQDPQEYGYSDAQMLAANWNVPTIIWGAKGENYHGADEYVDVNSFEKLEIGLKKVVDRWDSD
jgi:succinyl-diaminopimelate desuccinylase